jgi:putative DNA primase/helicase
LVLSPKKTLPTAQAFLEQFHHHPGGRTLHSYAGTILVWRGNRFVEIELETVQQRLQPWLHDALRYQFNKLTQLMELVDFESNPATIKAAVESIRAYAHLPATTTPPVWLDDRPDRPDPRNLLPFPSGTLDLATGKILLPTAALFNINALDFEYDPKAEPPERWILFLEQLWGDDLESVYLLQEWMGYCLVADTSQQKMLLMVGPKRSGKGTIGRVMTRLAGAGNVAGPTTSSLSGAFGLQPLIGKSLAIVSDARFTGENIGVVVVERLLCISGEDTLTVDRKFLGSITMKLPTRFMFLTNELPRMNDASGALAGRFVILRLTRSFYGQEDVTLTNQLMEELPGILLWAIEGLKRLRARGHFVQPKSVSDAVRDLEDLASPVGAFVRDCCEVGPGRRMWVDEMYDAWKVWCESDGRTNVTSKQVFGRDLAAAVPGVVCRRHSIQGRFYDGIALRAGGVQ